MRAGRNRHLVTIEQATEAQDGAGQPIETWTTYIERWASVKPLKGQELFTSAQRWPEVETKIDLRGDSLSKVITSKMRVNLKATSKIFNILAVMDLEERGIEVRLLCRREGDG